MKKNSKLFKYIFFSVFAFNIFSIVANAAGIDGTFSLMAVDSCESLLGSKSDQTSVIYYLQQIFNIIKYLTPVLVLVFSVIDFVRAVSSQDKDMLTKATKRTIIRIIVGLVVFVVPVVFDFVLKILDWSGVCGIN